jgi:hypothetical protein
VSASDQSPTAPPSKPGRRAIRRRPASWLDLIHDATGDWSRTWRLVVLAATAALCVASVVFVIQLRPDRWGSVLAVATFVSAAVGVRRFRSRVRAGSEADDQE